MCLQEEGLGTMQYFCPLCIIFGMKNIIVDKLKISMPMDEKRKLRCYALKNIK